MCIRDSIITGGFSCFLTVKFKDQLHNDTTQNIDNGMTHLNFYSNLKEGNFRIYFF